MLILSTHFLFILILHKTSEKLQVSSNHSYDFLLLRVSGKSSLFPKKVISFTHYPLSFHKTRLSTLYL